MTSRQIKGKRENEKVKKRKITDVYHRNKKKNNSLERLQNCFLHPSIHKMFINF